MFKKVTKKILTRKGMDRAAKARQHKTERFKMLARLRNGVEMISSILKNIYNVNDMPAHGLVRIHKDQMQI